MRILNRILAASAGVAAIATTGPASAQYYPSYGYAQPYAVNTSVAASQCTAAVQNRLYARRGLGGILGSLIGASATTPQVLSITQVNMRGNGLVRVRGLASSGRARGYGAYGMGAYGALGYGYASAADLSFRCDVAPN